MNRIQGVLHGVQSDGHLTIVDVMAGTDMFTSLVLNDIALPSNPGDPVALMFKESDTAIALSTDCTISCANRCAGPIVGIVARSLVTRVTIDYHGVAISSLILSRSAARLQLHDGMRVVCFVKSSSLMLDYGADHGI